MSQEQEIREWLEKPSRQSREKLPLSGAFSTTQFDSQIKQRKEKQFILLNYSLFPTTPQEECGNLHFYNQLSGEFSEQLLDKPYIIKP